jgi:xanthine/CO dehydrogenase XdhC/CoxF family maturation factor
MGVLTGWTKNPNPPRIIIECGEKVNVLIENMDSTPDSLVKLVTALFSLNHGNMRAEFLKASQNEKNVSDPVQRAKIIELWAAMEKHRKDALAHNGPQYDPKYFIKPTEVIPIAIAKTQSGEEE